MVHGKRDGTRVATRESGCGRQWSVRVRPLRAGPQCALSRRRRVPVDRRVKTFRYGTWDATCHKPSDTTSRTKMVDAPPCFPAAASGLRRRRCTRHPASGTRHRTASEPHATGRAPLSVAAPLIHASDGELLAHRSSVVMSTPTSVTPPPSALPPPAPPRLSLVAPLWARTTVSAMRAHSSSLLFEGLSHDHIEERRRIEAAARGSRLNLG